MSEVKEPSTDLAVIGTLNAVAVFSTDGGVDAVLGRIRKEVMSVDLDISTAAGRDKIRSLAYKVARSKTALDDLGKGLGDSHYQAWKAIAKERSRIEVELDGLRDEVRKPLTDWENAEKDRVAEHEAAITDLLAQLNVVSPPGTADDISGALGYATTLHADRDWQEFAKRAADTRASVIETLSGRHRDAVKAEAEAAELVRLRAEEAARLQHERDERIAAEAAAKAKREAEDKAATEAKVAAEKARLEQDRVENERRAAEARAKQAEDDRIAAAAKAEADKKVAAEKAARELKEHTERTAREVAEGIRAERQRQADAKAEEERETARRAADKAHRASINREACAALVTFGESEAREIVTLIAQGRVPHVRIDY